MIYMTILAPYCFSQTAGKTIISGVLADSITNNPVPFATIALMQEGKMISGTTTDTKGEFIISGAPYGKFALTISSVGYRKREIAIELDEDRQMIKLGSISFVSENKTLNEVTVMGQKSIVEDKGDKLIYNAEKDISNTGGTAVDVLRKVPALSVDLNGNVQMRGE